MPRTNVSLVLLLPPQSLLQLSVLAAVQSRLVVQGFQSVTALYVQERYKPDLTPHTPPLGHEN